MAPVLWSCYESSCLQVGFPGPALGGGGRQNKPETFEETTFTLSLWQIIDE